MVASTKAQYQVLSTKASSLTLSDDFDDSTAKHSGEKAVTRCTVIFDMAQNTILRVEPEEIFPKAGLS